MVDMLGLDFNNTTDIYEKIGNYDKRIYVWGIGSVAAGVKEN